MTAKTLNPHVRPRSLRSRRPTQGPVHARGVVADGRVEERPEEDDDGDRDIVDGQV